MGEKEEKNCSSCGYMTLLTFIRIAGGVVGALYLSFFAAATAPVALLMGYTLCMSSVVDNGFGKKGFSSYMIFMGIFNLLWIFAASNYDARVPSFETSITAYVYLGLVINAVIDFYAIKKKVHKWGHSCTNKETRKEYKALKREKKMRKIQEMNNL